MSGRSASVFSPSSTLPVPLFDRLGKIPSGNGLSWRFPQEKAACTPKTTTFDPLGKIRMGNRLSWRFPIKRRRLRQNSPGGLGKFSVEPVYLGDHAFFRWRLCQSRRPAWENSLRNPFMMAIPQEKAGMALKPATRGRLGKNRSGTRLSWRFRKKKRRLRQNRRPSTGSGKIPAEPVYDGDLQEQRRSDWENNKDW